MLIGRSVLCDQLTASVAAAAAGHGSVTVLTGEPGVGKSALLDFALSSGSEMHVLHTVCVEQERLLPYAAAADLLRPIEGFLPELPRPQAAALTSALRLGPAAEMDRFAVCAATLNLILVAARHRPLLIVIDDAHWIDDESGETLLFALRRVNAAAVCALLAYRTGPDVLRPPDHLATISVPGLDRSEAAQLIEAFGHRVDDLTLDWLMDQTGGNPLALTDLPKYLTADEIERRTHGNRPAVVPKSMEQFYFRAISRLPQRTAQALLIASMTGGATALFWTVLAVDGLTAVDLLPACDAGLITVEGPQLTFRHPLVRSAVHQFSKPSERRRAHLVIAAALEDPAEDEPSMARAWHLADAATGWDDDVAALLEDAARASLARGAGHAAALAFERAADLTSLQKQRQARLISAANAEFAAGRTWRSAELLARVDAAGGHGSSEVAQLRGQLDIWSGAPLDGGRRLLAEAVRIRSVDRARAATLLVDALAGFALSGNLNMALDAAEQLQREAEFLGQPMGSLSAATVEMIQGIMGGDDCPDRNCDEAASLVSPSDAPVALLGPLVYVAVGYLCSDKLEKGHHVLQGLVRSARDLGALSVLSFALSFQSVFEFRRGQWDAALISGEESVRLAMDTGRETEIPNSLAALSLIEAGRGLPEARAHAEDAVGRAITAGARLIEAQAHSMLGLLDLGLGRLEVAVDELVICGDLAQSCGALQPGHVQWAPELVESLARSDRAGEAMPTVRFAVERGTAIGTPITLALAARCQGMTAGGNSYAAYFDEALKWHARGSSRPFEVARTHLCFGERLRRSKRRKDARRHLREAWTSFSYLGARPWADRALAELRAAGDHPEGDSPHPLDLLTPQEKEVAKAVAAGGTNREVAHQLYLSPKTVEYHLSRVYRKLGVSSRPALRDRLFRPSGG